MKIILGVFQAWVFWYSYQQWFSSVKVTTLSKHLNCLWALPRLFTFEVFIDTEI